MRIFLVAAACLLAAACGVSTQDEPEPLGTTTTHREAPTPVVTQRRHSTPVTTSTTSSTPAASTALAPSPGATGDR
jgi:hypothetical protein